MLKAHHILLAFLTPIHRKFSVLPTRHSPDTAHPKQDTPPLSTIRLPKMASILNLPAEILHLFTDHLATDWKALNSLARTSKTLYGVVNPRLYRLGARCDDADSPSALPSPSPSQAETRAQWQLPVEWAIKTGRAGTMARLLAYYDHRPLDAELPPSPQRIDFYYGPRTLLSAAIFHNCPVIVSLLLHAGASPNTRALGSGFTALHLAAAYGMPEIVGLLVEHGAELEGPAPAACDARSNWTTPLHVATAHGNAAAMRALLLAGAAVDGRNVLGRTPLMHAVAQLYPEPDKLELLLRFGADVNASAADNYHGRGFGEGCATVLRFALAGNLDTIRLLVARGAHISPPGADTSAATTASAATSDGGQCKLAPPVQGGRPFPLALPPIDMEAVVALLLGGDRTPDSP